MPLLGFVLAVIGQPATLGEVAERGGPAPLQTLDALYQAECSRPCELVGFSFVDPSPDLELAIARGANSGGRGSMWVPVRDLSSPTGLSGPDPTVETGVSRVGQIVHLGEPATALGLPIPTWTTTGASVVLRVYSAPQGAPAELVSAAEHEDVADCETYYVRGDFAPGRYIVEVERAPHSRGRAGVWAVPDELGGMLVDGVEIPHARVEVRAVAPDGAVRDLFTPTSDHWPVELTGDRYEQYSALGFAIAFSVGSWNNGGFPYYPKWFLDENPEVAMLDQYGQPMISGMVGEPAPWTNVSNPVIERGTEEHIRRTVSALKGKPALRYWVLGGECLYFTYLDDRRLADYSRDSQDHFRAWLRVRYGGDLGRLNEAWRAGFRTWADVSPPVGLERSAACADFALFRFYEMAERFGRHYAAALEADPDRLILSCNHGTLFSGRSYFGLGCDPVLYAQATDGFEMGQIMADDDPERYNLLWMAMTQAHGKVLAPVRLAYKKSDPRARGGGTSYTPESARRYFGESIGSGAWHTGLIQWQGDLPDGEWGVKGTPAEEEIGRIFGEWHEVEHSFDGTWPVRPRVGVLWSRTGWALDGFQPVWQALHEALIANQVPYLPLTGETSYDGLCAVIVADNAMLDGGDRERLAAYAEGGGLLILSGENGVLDDRCRPTPELGGAVPHALRIAEAGTPSERAAEMVAALPASARPMQVELEALGEIRDRRTENLTGGRHNTPIDLAAGEVVQTIRVTRSGLLSVAVSCPTYAKTYRGAPLRIEVSEPGAGEVLGSAVRAADDLPDNGWHEVRLTRSPAPGADIAVRLVPPEGIGAQELGVWAYIAADAPRLGALTQGGVEVPGSLEVRTSADEPRAARQVVEAFTLTDGLNTVAVLVNISGTPVRYSLEPEPDLVPDLGWPRVVRRLDPHTQLGEDIIPPHRTALVEFAADVTQDSAAALVEAIEARVAELGDSADQLTRARCARARAALDRRLPHKAAAHVLALVRSLAVTPEVTVRDGRLAVRARVTDVGTGSAPEGVSGSAVLVPLWGWSVPLTESAPGLLEGSVALGDLPLWYDVEARSYRPYRGAARVEVRVQAGARRGAAATRALLLPM